MNIETPAPVWRRLLGGYESLLRLLAGGSMILLVAITVSQVLIRYVFGTSLIWAEEVCRYLLIWQTFLLIGYAYTRGEMMAVDVLPDMAGPKAAFVMRLIMLLPILIFLWVLTENGYAYAARFQRQVIPAGDFIWTSLTGGSLGLSIFWIYISVAVGSALLGLHMIVATIRDFLDLKAGRTPAHAAKHPIEGAE